MSKALLRFKGVKIEQFPLVCDEEEVTSGAIDPQEDQSGTTDDRIPADLSEESPSRFPGGIKIIDSLTSSVRDSAR